MAPRRPIAFLSYVRSDDEHDDGRITAFRKRLEGEVRMQTGDDFAIFQDRNDIAWGHNWEERIKQSLSDVTFLIPVITPSFFRSYACRSEFLTFAHRENTLGVNRLILPLYYVSSDQLATGYKTGTDEVADILNQRNWTDWRPFRFKVFSDEKAAAALAEMASAIKDSIAELNSIWAISRDKQGATAPASSYQVPEASPEEEGSVIGETSLPEAAGSELYGVPELDPADGDNVDAAEVRAHGYYAFTKRFDEVIDAAALADKEELVALSDFLSINVRQLNRRLGDSLTSFLTRFSSKIDSPSLAVSILIDNSGSMRGSKITLTAAWCILILEWMDRLRIPTEILGFTTRAWKGGSSRELWLSSGKPEHPGRLNDLRHIVYKSFSASNLSTLPNLAGMVRDGILKENIDGEGLLWAASRLHQRPEKRKIQFILSDGAPVDDSTLSVNPGNYLERHLLRVIDSFPTNIQLYALGLEHDVSRYYSNSARVSDEIDIGPRLFEMLVNDPGFGEAFTSSRPERRYRFPVLSPDPAQLAVRPSKRAKRRARSKP
jgi:cobaltochelatase CobT